MKLKLKNGTEVPKLTVSSIPLGQLFRIKGEAALYMKVRNSRTAYAFNLTTKKIDTPVYHYGISNCEIELVDGTFVEE